MKLLALDIDGTLIPPDRYGHSHEPSRRLTAAIQNCVAAGIEVILASGRMFPGTSHISRHLGLSSPLICQQGCSVHLPDGTMTHEFLIERAVALEICQFAREIDRAYEWFNPLRYIASARSLATEQYGQVSGIVPEYHLAPENSGVRPTGVGIISSAAEANAIHREIVARHGHELHVLDFPEVTVAVAQDANKGHALSLLCDDLGIDRSEVLAVGDSVNDASMLVWAGRGIGMSHSDAYAVDAADELLPDEPEALAEFLEELARRPF
ncbi:MAG: HAD family hydrolase [Dehalococcoidia bacterium]